MGAEEAHHLADYDQADIFPPPMEPEELFDMVVSELANKQEESTIRVFLTGEIIAPEEVPK